MQAISFPMHPNDVNPISSSIKITAALFPIIAYQLGDFEDLRLAKHSVIFLHITRMTFLYTEPSHLYVRSYAIAIFLKEEQGDWSE
jgi:hypothetical protein